MSFLGNQGKRRVEAHPQCKQKVPIIGHHINDFAAWRSSGEYDTQGNQAAYDVRGVEARKDIEK